MIKVNAKCKKLGLRYVHILMLMYYSDSGFLKPELIRLLPYTVNRINEGHDLILKAGLIDMVYLEKYRITAKGQEIIKGLIFAMRRQFPAMGKQYCYIKE